MGANATRECLLTGPLTSPGGPRLCMAQPACTPERVDPEPGLTVLALLYDSLKENRKQISTQQDRSRRYHYIQSFDNC